MSRLTTWGFLVWMSWLAVIPQALAQAPQDDPAFKKVAALYQQGVDAKNRKAYAESTALFEKALAVKPLPAMLSSLPATLHHAVACNHALAGKTALAFASLEQAMAAGYAEWEDAQEDADLKVLRGPATVGRADGAHEGERAAGTRVRGDFIAKRGTGECRAAHV